MGWAKVAVGGVSEVGSRVPQSAQKSRESGLSDRQFGHFIARSLSFSGRPKDNKTFAARQHAGIMSRD
jgi:hypothetical protein